MHNDKDHAEFEKEVYEWLIAEGWIIPPQPTYHEYMPQEIRDELSTMYDLSSQYVRTRADRLAIHLSRGLTVEWEVKTAPNDPKKANFTIEALPLAHHINKSRLGARCVYVLKHFLHGTECGFAAYPGGVPKIENVTFPEKCDRYSAHDEYVRRLRPVFPDVEFREHAKVGGSGDPFVFIKRSTLASLPHWKDIFGTLSPSPGAKTYRPRS